jgi:hypothetical protein
MCIPEIGATVLDASYLFLRDGIVYFRYKVFIAGFSKVMDRRKTCEEFREFPDSKHGHYQDLHQEDLFASRFSNSICANSPLFRLLLGLHLSDMTGV